MRIEVLAVTAAVTALGMSGCGQTSLRAAAAGPTPVPPIPSSPALAHATSTAVRGHQLVAFRRVFGTDPMASTLTVYSGGQAVATLGYGGRNGLQVHRFQMPAAELRLLLDLVRHTHLRTTDVSDFHYYIYWIFTDRGSYRLRDGLVPRAAQPLIADLNAITDKRTG